MRLRPADSTPRVTPSKPVPEMGRWLAEYRCGCTLVRPLRRELLEYCGKHGENRRLVVKLLSETECGLA